MELPWATSDSSWVITGSNRSRPTARKSRPRCGTVPLRSALMISLRRSRLVSIVSIQVELPFEPRQVEFDLVLVAVEREDLVTIHVQQTLNECNEPVQSGSGDTGSIREGGRRHETAAGLQHSQGLMDDAVFWSMAADQFLLALVHL